MTKEQIEQLMKELTGLYSQRLFQAAKVRNWSSMSAYEKMEALKKELVGQKIEKHFYVNDLYEDSIIISVFGESYAWEVDKLFRVPYIIKNDVVSFGSPVEVERVNLYKEIKKVDQSSPDSAKDNEETDKEEIIEYKEIGQAKHVEIPLHQDCVRLEFDLTQLEQAKKSGELEQGLKFRNAVASVFEIVNSWGHYYPRKVWQNAIPELEQRAKNKKLVGEADHPDKPSVRNQCIIFDEIWIEQNQVMVNGTILPTSVGKDIIVQALAGVPIYLSSRAVGGLAPGEVNGQKVMVVQDNFKPHTFDIVWEPAAPGSEITEFQVNQGAANVVSLVQSSKVEGEVVKMDELEKLLALIEAGKEQGVDLAQEEESVNELIQMQKDGVSEDKLKSLMRTVYGNVKAKVFPKPGDPDKGSGVQNPVSKVNQSEGGGGSLSQGGKAPEGGSQNLQQEGSGEMTAVLQMLNSQAKETEINNLVQSVPEQFRSFYKEQLGSVEKATEVKPKFEALKQQFALMSGMSGIYFGTAGVGMTDAEKRYESAPKNGHEAIEQLLEGIEEKKNPHGRIIQTPDNRRNNLRKIFQNMERTNPGSLERYCKIAQGQLLQAGELTTADLTTTNAFLFPIVRRAYEKLIAHEFASIQPMSQPEGKIFFIDHSTEDGDDLSVFRSRNYSDGVTELTGTAKKIKMSLTSSTLSVSSKKLQTEISYEVIQDLMANFGLDAQEETMGAAATQIALEWNYQILYDMATAAGTAGNVNFGKDAPAGWTQKEWNQVQMFIHMQSASNLIFANRYGHATHIFTGTTNALQLAKLGGEGGFILTKGEQSNTIYEGFNKFGTINGAWPVFTSPYLDTVAPDKLIFVRKGEKWSDVPYVFSPYASSATPAVHSAGSFKVNQGIMDRAGKKVVVPKSIATMTFVAGEGTAI